MEQYIKPFVDVCMDVFKQFIGCEIVVKTPYFSEKDSIEGGDISAVIGFTGEARGAVIVSMQKEVAIKLTDILTGSQHLVVDDDVLDAVGEIVNIIAGNVKQKLEEAMKMVISLPTIVEGAGHVIRWPGNQARLLCIPFKIFEDDVFTLLVAIEVVHQAL
ncbi:MAG: chemotaxis protein CheX [Treponema sp.]|jgi:chemotaxis protein CheX|nr:chemotaxis protein CheX [Treponema sp.]